MIITITIDDTAASSVLQNIAIIKQWGTVTDEEARAKLATDLRNDVRRLAMAGASEQARIAEVAAMKTATNSKITVA